MKKKLVILILIILIGLAVSYLIYELVDEEANNSVTLQNDLNQYAALVIDCTPRIPCQKHINKGDKATYKDVEQLGIHLGSWLDFEYYDLQIPEKGSFTMKLTDVVNGNVPKQIELHCFKGEAHGQLKSMDCKTKTLIKET